MFLLVSALVILSLAALIFYFQKRQQPQLTEKESSYLPDETNLRPLFSPDKAAIDRLLKEETAAKQRIASRAEHDVLDSQLALARDAWQASPGRKTTSQLIKLATDTKRADTFATTASEILEAHRDGRIAGLTDNDVAALLDSHMVLLPVDQRGSGALFLIKQEVAKLRSPAEPEVG